jgi:hypothetical protein
MANQHKSSQLIVKAAWQKLEVLWVRSDRFLELLRTGEQQEIQQDRQ